MSSIIKTVSYESNDAKIFRQKLGEHLGIHLLTIILTDGEQIDGILSEVGNDYLNLVVDDHDVVIPIKNVLYFKYSH
ncbi:MAG: hypothetical protein HOE30_01985 [Deltaproteobacteria bacterium]|jgi:hypothetical protein|nr:hypothetical protein [Deltaproteobacteria bacterium]MBT4087241.1 hypothetical protein [Deltaproteobacteria bacterium]MBT4264891.1 hypothetical protein [Deltaproteobacteria bacterium]MBT4640023.1 hypothetical protein [Deltaproteobacteria bacterium]MBT6612303.1 hypothetical protein [Deltaproteobacteria bacterium]